MALLWTIIPFMSWVGVAIMALVTLRKGATEGFFILLWIALPSVVLLFLGYISPFFYGVVCGSLVVWALAIVLRETTSWTAVLYVGVLIGSLGVLLAHAFINDLSGYWVNFIEQDYKGVIQDLSPQLSGQDLQDLIQLMGDMATGIQAAALLLVNLFSLLVGRWFQDRLYNPGGLAKELCQIKLGYGADLILILIVAIIVLGLVIAWDLLPLMVMMFFLAGLSLIHALIAVSKTIWLWLVCFYGLLILFFPYVASLVAILAFTDSLIDIRSKFGNFQRTS